MRTIWLERSNWTFEGEETSMLKLKLMFLPSLYEWMTVIGNLPMSSLVEFIDVLNIKLELFRRVSNMPPVHLILSFFRYLFT